MFDAFSSPNDMDRTGLSSASRYSMSRHMSRLSGFLKLEEVATDDPKSRPPIPVMPRVRFAFLPFSKGEHEGTCGQLLGIVVRNRFNGKVSESGMQRE